MDANGYWCNRNCATHYCYVCEIRLNMSIPSIGEFDRSIARLLYTFLEPFDTALITSLAITTTATTAVPALASTQQTIPLSTFQSTVSLASTTTLPLNYHPCNTSIYISIDGTNHSLDDDVQFRRQKLFIVNRLVDDRWNRFERIAVQLYAEYKGGACIVPIAAFDHIHSYKSFRSIINRTDSYAACERQIFDESFYL